MPDVLVTVHTWTGYLVAVVVVIAALIAFGRARDAREFVAAPFSVAMVLLDIQVLLGLVLYGAGGYWEAAPLLAYVHPALALVALGAGHASLGRARKEQMAVTAHRAAGVGLLLAFVLVLAAIGVSTAANA